MRTRIKVTNLSPGQQDYLWDHLPERLEIPDGAVRVCVEFELDPQMGIRHVEMPVRAFVALMTRLQEVQARAEAALTPGALPDEEGMVPSADPGPARQDCAFCHRERNAKDDNHAPECPYWTIGPGALPDEEGRCKCGFRAPELGPHPACPTHGPGRYRDEG